MPKVRQQHRGQKVVDTVLDCTIDEISERGYAELTIESVAARARVNKTTVYRRWPTKDELVQTALARETQDLFDPPNTGDLVEDLLFLSRRLSAFACSRQGKAFQILSLQHGSGEVDAGFVAEGSRR